jgi:hypothetical protein
MLTIRPNCEYCDKNLAANSTQAMICSYECTFCATCVNDILENVCPNCGGGFSPRPIRPKTARRKGLSISHQPGSTKRVQTKYSIDELKAFSKQAKHIKPKDR